MTTTTLNGATAMAKRQLPTRVLTFVAALVFVVFAVGLLAVAAMYFRWKYILPNVGFADFCRLFIRHFWR
jgi:putative Ca2+/H+ antiporter (TMEM165/GDT1 family)